MQLEESFMMNCKYETFNENCLIESFSSFTSGPDENIIERAMNDLASVAEDEL